VLKEELTRSFSSLIGSPSTDASERPKNNYQIDWFLEKKPVKVGNSFTRYDELATPE
jgi:hypothetical protein